MIIAKRVTLMVAVTLASTFALAQAPLARGQKYVLRVPLEALTLETVSVWSGSAVYVGTIQQSGADVAVNGSMTWLGQGFPFDKPLTIKKVRTDRKSGQYEIELGGDFAGEPIVKLRFANETAAAASGPTILIAASRQQDISAFREAAYAELAKRTFTGQLAQLPEEKQRALLEAMRNVGTGKASVETYKDNSYLSVNLGTGDYVYNTLQMTQTERVARRMADALASVKSLYRAVGACPEGVHGVKVTFLASYKNFLREYEQGADNVQAYFPCELIAKFQDADITSQALVNGSVVIVNGDRIEVSLTQ